jgi:hypothetical protein
LNDSVWRFRVWKGEFQRLERGIHHYTPVGGVADGDLLERRSKWRNIILFGTGRTS